MQIKNNTKNSQVESIFDAAIALENENERENYLLDACGADPELYSRVEALIRAHQEAGNFLNSETVERPIEGPGVVIDRYKILQEIGEGGFGTVYMAEQQRPVRRKVAIKIIKLGMDTKQVIARFEAERQALALMDHPNVAKVFDAGATESGRLYFVMELVRGVSITQYCDSRNLNLRARLELFLDVCHAVQHAHRKGIIHRDIKPTNIMVTLHDGRPVPKIIDFGVSKATNQRLTERTLFTEYHQFIGTPQYMSPEQAEMSGLDIDTRSDLYSLGCVLYELLTGAPPFDRQRLKEAGYVELQKIICNEDPLKPSTRVATLLQQDTLVAKHHGVQPNMFSKTLQGELDCIVMKAMDKDRTRRYDSASELAADITRYLNDEPVIAAPPGMLYSMSKFVRRHRVGVLTSCLVALSLLVGSVLAVSGLVRANHEMKRTQEIADYLHNVLVVSDNQQGPGGRTYNIESVADEARQLFSDDPATVAAVLNSISIQLQSAGDYSESEYLLHESIAIWKQTQGPQDSNISVALSRLGSLLALKGDESGAEKAFREAISICENRSDETPYLAKAYSGLAEILQGRAKYDEAEKALRRALAIRRKVAPHQKIEIALTMNRLANVLSLGGKADKLNAILDECIQAFREALPANQPAIAKVLTQTAAFYVDQKEFEKAQQHLREALDIYQKYPSTSQFYSEVALRYLSITVNQLDDDSLQYVPKRREYLNLARKILGENHPRIGIFLSEYARYMADHDQFIEAIDLATASLTKLDRTVGLETFIQGAHDAIEAATREISLDPQRAPKDYALALKAVDTLIARQPKQDRFVVIRAALLYRQKKYVDALDILKAWKPPVEKTTQESLMALGFKAMLFSQLGQSDEAQKQHKRFKELLVPSEFARHAKAKSLSQEIESLLNE